MGSSIEKRVSIEVYKGRTDIYKADFRCLLKVRYVVREGCSFSFSSINTDGEELSSGYFLLEKDQSVWAVADYYSAVYLDIGLEITRIEGSEADEWLDVIREMSALSTTLNMRLQNAIKDKREILSAYDNQNKETPSKKTFFGKKNHKVSVNSEPFIRKTQSVLATTLEYQMWIDENEIESDDSRIDSGDVNFAVVILGAADEGENADRTLASINAQIYRRYKLYKTPDYSGINEILDSADEDYVLFVDEGDELSVHAFYEVAKVINKHAGVGFIYSDEDYLSDDRSRRCNPIFKPDWSPDTLVSFGYTGQLAVFRRELLVQAGGIRAEYGRQFDYDAVLRIAELITCKEIVHIDKVLYHRNQVNEHKASKSVIEKLKKDMILRRGLNAHLEWQEDVCNWRVVYEPSGKPLVSIVILSKDNKDILSQAVASIESYTDYRNYEIIVVDNGSSNRQEIADMLEGRATYIYEPMDFNFSAQCNIGAKTAKGEYIMLMNDDVEIVQKDWLTRLLGTACQKHVGAVGAKLYYPNSDMIQHDGVINLAPGPSHIFINRKDNVVHYGGRNRYEYDYMAVTGALLLVEKALYLQVGMMDEDLPVAYNDVDLCMSFMEAGYYNVLRNDVIAFHHESYSRGHDELSMAKLRRLDAERKYLYDKHGRIQGEDKDPFYSTNFSQFDGNCRIKVQKDDTISDRYRLTNEVKGIRDSFEIFIDDIRKEQLVTFTLHYRYNGEQNVSAAEKYLLLKFSDDYIFELDCFEENGQLIAVIDSAAFFGEARDFSFGLLFKDNDKYIFDFLDKREMLDPDEAFFGVSVIMDTGDIGEQSDSINTIIDVVGINSEADSIYLKGWSVNEEKTVGNRSFLRYIVYDDGIKKQKVNLRLQYRADIDRLYADRTDMLYSGFETVIRKSWIEDIYSDIRWYMVYENLMTHKKEYGTIDMSKLML